MCVYVGLCVFLVYVLAEARGSASAGNGVVGCCELSDVGARDCIQASERVVCARNC